jgi:hypothetical protein
MEVEMKTQKRKTQPDITVENEGTIILFTPQTNRGAEWIEQHVQSDAMHFGKSLVVEHRYARDLAQGMVGDGLSLGD